MLLFSCCHSFWKSGNTRFGVIYFKPDEHRYLTEQYSWIGTTTCSSSSVIGSTNTNTAVLPSQSRSINPGLVVMPQLLSDFYRSVFNTFLTAPFTFISDHSPSSADANSTDDDDDCKRSLLGSSDFEVGNQSNVQTNSNIKEKENEDNIFFDNKDSIINNNRTTMKAVTKQIKSAISPALIDLEPCANSSIRPSPNRKAFPGMATRLATVMKK